MSEPIPSPVPPPAAAPVAARNPRAILRQQQRTATLVSLITALLFMVLIGLILAVILMAVTPTEQPNLVAYTGVSEKPKKIKEPKVQTNVQRKPAAPSMAATKMVVANTQAPTSIPVPEIVVEDISMDIGGRRWMRSRSCLVLRRRMRRSSRSGKCAMVISVIR